jgi:hypothetical protein
MTDEEYFKLEEEARTKKAESDQAAEKLRLENQRLRDEQDEREMRRKVVSGMYNQFDGETYSYNGRLSKTAEEIFAIPKEDFQKFVNELLFGVSEIKQQDEETAAEILRREKILQPLYEFITTDIQILIKEAPEADFKAAVESATKKKEIHDKSISDAREAARVAETERLAKLKKEADEKAEAERLEKAGDRERLMTWIDSMLIKGLPGEGLSPEAEKIADSIFARFSDFKAWAKKEAEKL